MKKIIVFALLFTSIFCFFGQATAQAQSARIASSNASFQRAVSETEERPPRWQNATVQIGESEFYDIDSDDKIEFQMFMRNKLSEYINTYTDFVLVDPTNISLLASSIERSVSPIYTDVEKPTLAQYTTSVLKFIPRLRYINSNYDFTLDLVESVTNRKLASFSAQKVTREQIEGGEIPGKAFLRIMETIGYKYNQQHKNELTLEPTSIAEIEAELNALNERYFYDYGTQEDMSNALAQRIVFKKLLLEKKVQSAKNNAERDNEIEVLKKRRAQNALRSDFLRVQNEVLYIANDVNVFVSTMEKEDVFGDFLFNLEAKKSTLNAVVNRKLANISELERVVQSEIFRLEKYLDNKYNPIDYSTMYRRGVMTNSAKKAIDRKKQAIRSELERLLAEAIETIIYDGYEDELRLYEEISTMAIEHPSFTYNSIAHPDRIKLIIGSYDPSEGKEGWPVRMSVTLANQEDFSTSYLLKYSTLTGKPPKRIGIDPDSEYEEYNNTVNVYENLFRSNIPCVYAQATFSINQRSIRKESAVPMFADYEKLIFDHSGTPEFTGTFIGFSLHKIDGLDSNRITGELQTSNGKKEFIIVSPYNNHRTVWITEQAYTYRNFFAKAFAKNHTELETQNAILAKYANDLNFVRVGNFYVSKTEVTQGLYEKIMKNNPSETSRGAGMNYPVNLVTWNEAIEFANKFSNYIKATACYDIGRNKSTIWQTGKYGIRLLTESEWEQAAGPAQLNYSGDSDYNRVAWFSENSEKRSHPVATKNPNAYGIFDMSGNVLEWTWSGYSGGTNGEMVLKGGSWETQNSPIKTYWYAPKNAKRRDTGFRIGMTVVNLNNFDYKNARIPAIKTRFIPEEAVSPDWLDGTPHFKISGNKLIKAKRTARGYLIIPQGVRRIKTKAFSRFKNKYTKINGLRIPASVTRIDRRAFFNAAIDQIILEEGITSIGDRAFHYADQVRSIILPSTLQTLGRNALSSCYLITDLRLPASLTKIDAFALSNLRGIERIEIPASVSVLETGTLSGCTNLREVVLNEGLVSIGYGCFADCANLETIRIPSTVQSISRNAFIGAHRLSTILLPETMRDAIINTNAKIEYYK